MEQVHTGPGDAPLALTMGDPAGIGLDVTLLAYAGRHHEPIPNFVFIGDPGLLASRSDALGLSLPLAKVRSPAEARDVFADALPVLSIDVAGDVQPGRPALDSMAAVKHAIERAVALVRAGEARAVVTNPISKVELYRAGFTFPGHTEFLASLSCPDGDPPMPVMMLAAGPFKVVPVTIHIPLSEVPSTLSRSLLVKTIDIASDSLRRYFGFARPRLAISGLNPHAGEDGTLGREEIEIIAPAIAIAREAGHDVTGPLPADTMFHAAAREQYDVALCMYHDQALTPFKTLAFDDGVNVTLGLPFVRTSPDHGTAFDIAGTGKANPRSLIEALRLAQSMSETATGEV